MANNVKNVSAGKPKVSGAIFVADIGTTLPTDAVSDLDAAFKGLGYVSEDGVENENTAEFSSTKAWGGDTVIQSLTEKPDTFKYTLLEVLSVEVLKHVYGDDNVTGTLATGITVKANSDEPIEKSVVIDMNLRDGALKRVVIPDCKLTEVGTIVYKDDEAVGYECTETAFPDATGNTHYEYIIRS